MKAFIFATACYLSIIGLMYIWDNNPVVQAQKEIKVEVSIDGTPYWVPVVLNDVVHVVIDNNKLTTIKSYSNDAVY